MSFIGNMTGLGGNGGNQGYSFSAQSAPLLQTTNAAQLGTAYNTAQDALSQQQSLVNALNAQNGIQNQSNVYGQLQNVAQGNTANLAGAQLAQSTGQNVAAQAAAAAGQRGASQNVGMLQRNSANAGANIQQQAAGQGAVLQAQQQQAALGQLSGLSTQQVAQQQGGVSTLNQAAQGEQSNLLNAAASLNNANVQNTSNMNNVNLSQAGQVEKNQAMIGSLGAQAGASLLASMAQGGSVHEPVAHYDGGGGVAGILPMLAMLADGGPVKMADGGMPSSFVGKYLNGIGPSIGNITRPSGTGGTFGGTHSSEMSIGSGGMPSSSSNNGGGMQMPSVSKATPSTPAAADPIDTTSQTAMAGDAGTSAVGGSAASAGAAGAEGAGAVAGGDGALLALAAKGGKVPALVSPGERYLPPKEVKEVAKGKKEPIKAGEKIPGKPKFPGNNYANDIVPKKLEKGGIVLPNSVTQSKDPAEAARSFVAAILAKKGAMPGKPAKSK